MTDEPELSDWLKYIEIQLLARKRYRWDIFCDKYPDPQPTYLNFFVRIAQLRPLFYPLSVIKDFPDEVFGHD